VERGVPLSTDAIAVLAGTLGCRLFYVTSGRSGSFVGIVVDSHNP